MGQANWRVERLLSRERAKQTQSEKVIRFVNSYGWSWKVPKTEMILQDEISLS